LNKQKELFPPEVPATGVTVITGPAAAGKTKRLLGEYRRALANGPIGGVLWLTPTIRLARQVRDQLLDADLPGCLSPNCLTFARMAQAVLDAAPVAMRPITPWMKRGLLRRLLDEALSAGRLKYFAPIAHTPGLLDSVCLFVGELKRLEIWPDEFKAACGGKPSEKDRDLWRLYNDYQLLLNRHQLYDAEGRMWSARKLLRETPGEPLDRLTTVLVDGFTDFTRTQHEILQILAARASSVIITLPLEAAPCRSELFGKTMRTLAELGVRHPGLRVEEMPRAASPVRPAQAHLERQLFKHPRQVEPAADASGLHILAASGQVAEIEAIARQIKGLLTGGRRAEGAVRPGDILVVFRSLGDAAELVREIFADFGIPAVIEAQPPLERCGSLAALVALLRLHLQDWPFRELLAFLSNNYFQPNWPEWHAGEAALAADRLVRRLSLPSGRVELLEQIARVGNQPRPEADDGDDRLYRRRLEGWQQARLGWPLLVRLGEALSALPEQAPAEDWAGALEELSRQTGLRGSDPRGTAAWDHVLATLRGRNRLSGWMREAAPRLDLAAITEHLIDLLRCETLPGAPDEAGCVRVLSAPSVRGLSARYVFAAGLSEKAFPPPEREDRVYGEVEYQRFIEAGLPLVNRVERAQEEMLLFYELVTRATQRLHLSYPALDESAQPLSPSPYLTAVERACGADRIARTVDTQLSPVPLAAEVYRPRDYRVLGVSQALQGKSKLLAGLWGDDGLSKTSANMLAALRLTLQRRQDGFGPYEGMLAGPGVLEQLLARYGPERCWSASQLEQYARCPYQFYLQHVLALEPLAEIGLATDYRSRGKLLHGTLSGVHRKLNQQRGCPTSPCSSDEAQFLKSAVEVLDTLFEALPKRQPLDDALSEIDRRMLLQWLANYHQQHAKYDAGWKECDTPLAPSHFEVSFGPSKSGKDPEQPDFEAEGTDVLSTEKPFELVCGDETIRISGRIDRIDRGTVGGQSVFNVVDYKSGSPRSFSSKAVHEGYALQLPLYALATQELLSNQNALPWRAGYWYVKDDGFKQKQAVVFSEQQNGRLHESEEWSQLKQMLLARVLALVHGIRAGQFPMHSADEECTNRCDFSTVCRISQVRSLEKSWEPPLVEIT